MSSMAEKMRQRAAAEEKKAKEQQEKKGEVPSKGKDSDNNNPKVSIVSRNKDKFDSRFLPFDPIKYLNAGCSKMEGLGDDAVAALACLYVGLWSDNVYGQASEIYEKYISESPDKDAIKEGRVYQQKSQQARDFDALTKLIRDWKVIPVNRMSSQLLAIAFFKHLKAVTLEYVFTGYGTDDVKIRVPKLFYSKGVFATLDYDKSTDILEAVCMATNIILVKSEYQSLEAMIEGKGTALERNPTNEMWMNMAYPVSPWRLTFNIEFKALKRTNYDDFVALAFAHTLRMLNIMCKGTVLEKIPKSIPLDKDFPKAVARLVDSCQKGVRKARNVFFTGAVDLDEQDPELLNEKSLKNFNAERVYDLLTDEARLKSFTRSKVTKIEGLRA